jgi:hypothetical protein
MVVSRSLKEAVSFIGGLKGDEYVITGYNELRQSWEKRSGSFNVTVPAFERRTQSNAEVTTCYLDESLICDLSNMNKGNNFYSVTLNIL